MNTNRLHELVNECLKLTQKSYMHFKHGAIIIRNGRVISYGFNNEKDHAEVDALSKLISTRFKSCLLREGRKDRYYTTISEKMRYNHN